MSVFVTDGTVNLTNGSRTVTGTGTAWNGVVVPGNLFFDHTGSGYGISAVNSDDTLTLNVPYRLTSGSELTYEIDTTRGAERELSQRVGQLVGRYQAYPDIAVRFEGEILPEMQDRIDAKLAQLDAAAAAFPNQMSRTLHVDPVTGSDTNTGLSESQSLATVERACALGPNLGNLEIVVPNGADVLLQNGSASPSSVVSIRPRSPTGAPPRLQQQHVLGSSGYRSVTFGGNNTRSLIIRDSVLELLGAADLPSGASLSGPSGLLYKSAFSPELFTQASLYDVDITVSGGGPPLYPVFYGYWGGALFLRACTFSASDMAGNWVAGISAGTAPKDTGRILSDLPTL